MVNWMFLNRLKKYPKTNNQHCAALICNQHELDIVTKLNSMNHWKVWVKGHKMSWLGHLSFHSGYTKWGKSKKKKKQQRLFRSFQGSFHPESVHPTSQPVERGEKVKTVQIVFAIQIIIALMTGILFFYISFTT